MNGASRETVRWIALHVLPHEQRLRTWLLRTGTSPSDADDLLHDAYCRLGMMEYVSHIENPMGYVTTILRNLRREHLRRARIVRIEALTDELSIFLTDEGACPEQAADRNRQIDLIETIIAKLPERCRTIFRLRRLEGLSQKAIAQSLGVTESIVENDAAKGLRAILAALRPMEDRLVTSDAPRRYA